MSGQVFAPAVLDKVYAGLNAKIKASKPIIQKLFAAGMAAGEATQHGQSAKVPWLAASHAACPPPKRSTGQLTCSGRPSAPEKRAREAAWRPRRRGDAAPVPAQGGRFHRLYLCL